MFFSYCQFHVPHDDLCKEQRRHARSLLRNPRQGTGVETGSSVRDYKLFGPYLCPANDGSLFWFSQMNVFPGDTICIILDLEGFFVDKQFQIRELGCVSDNHDHDRYAFHPKTPFSELWDKDQRTITAICQETRSRTHGRNQCRVVWPVCPED